MAEAELKKLIHKRGTIKGKLTRFKTYLEENKSDIDKTQLHLRTLNLENVLSEFEELNIEIELLDTSEENHAEELDEFETLYYTLMSEAKSLMNIGIMDENTGVGRPNSSGLGANNLGLGSDLNIQLEAQVRLPIINLPTFTGSFDEWHSFSEGFQALISQNNSLTDTHKFYYLKSCLKGEAASVLHSLEATSSNYKIAWDLLKDRFENTRLIINKYTSSLFNYPNITKESSKEIRKFLDNLNKNIRALQALGQPTEHWDTLLIHLSLNKLPSTTVEEWEKSCKPKSLPTMADFLSFLENKSHILETLESQCQPTTPSRTNEVRNMGTSKYAFGKTKPYNNKPNQSTFISTDSPKNSKPRTNNSSNHLCEVCKGNHMLFSCKAFLNLTAMDRINKIRDLGLCLNCLKPGGHRAYECRASGCKLCDKKHNTLLHIPNETTKANVDLGTDCSQPSTNNDKPNGKFSMEASTVVHSSHSVTSPSHVLLPTAIVNVEDASGNLVPCRALLDSASQCNFITEHMTQILNLKKERVLSCVTGLGDQSTNSSKVVRTTIRSRFTAYSESFNCIVLPKITIDMPAVPINTSKWNLPNDIELADPNAHKPSRIDMLIGSELFMDLLCFDSRPKNSCPTLVKTKLGWVVSGKSEIDMYSMATNNTQTSNVCHFVSNKSLETELQRFWDLEDVGLNPSNKLSGDDLVCEEYFKETTKRDSSGRYTVSMPFNDESNNLGDSFDIAKRRFEQLERRFVKHPELKKDYSNFIHEYHELGHMVKANDQHQDTKSFYYIPHHAVIKESSTSTKLRVVFDCSAKTSNGLSLNDTLLVGPCIQQDLFSIVSRFRTHNYVLNADLEKMYRQILIEETQRDLLRILWRDNPLEPLQIFKLKTVTYGSACAPFLATRTLQQLAQDEETYFPKASKILTRDFYMDDLLTGGKSVEEVKQLQTDLISLLSKGGFKLRKWASNHEDLINHLPKEYIENKGDFSSNYSTKTLGLLWNSASDNFHYSINCKENQRVDLITKREVLSEIAQVFDPLGLISPIVIEAKIFMQDLWQCKLEWDEPLPTKQLTFWNSFREELKNVNKLTIPRRVLTSDLSQNVQIHGFSDASESAYGACIYIRQVDKGGNINVRLLCSKSKVAPVKKTTIPRLELCAALLLARLIHRILKTLNLSFDSCNLWSDSTIVLSWLMSPSTRWKTFVANRVSEIQELTNHCSWNHCRSEDNPADIVSRGKPPLQLIECHKWWYGPQWLEKPESCWPLSRNKINEETTLEERQVSLATASEEIFIEKLSNRYSSFVKLQRVVAFCFRFAKNLKTKDKIVGPLNNQELNNAHIVIVRHVQEQHFKEDIKAIKNNKSIPNTSKLKCLQPFLDKQNVLRVGGRLQNSSLDYDRKHPIILPNHQLTKYLIEDIHRQNLHIGSQQLLATVRQTYWPIRAKNTVKKICRECITCFKANPKPASQEMGILPKARVEPSRPFINTGVDYCGPFHIKNKPGRGGRTSKAYIAVFVCLAVKAVHLELVQDMTTEAFISALKRFMARRGKVAKIYSDNGTNFVGTDNELRELKEMFENENHQTMVKEELAAQNIEWHFTPPYSPNFGGLWEAAVKSTKFHLKRVAANALMTYDEFYTLLTQIEACLNSRPITPVSDDPNDCAYLTPGHFLIGEALNTNLEPDLTSLKINKLSRWQKTQQMFQHFWKRWSNEYLNLLQPRTKWTQEKKNLEVGDMVILKDENLPPLKWKLGRIIKTYPGKDNKVRVVQVKTSRGIFKRNVKSICPLPKEKDD